jgi:PEP-CTERM motif-containing protein
MKRVVFYMTVALLGLTATVDAATFRFDKRPFDGSDAPNQPGRQVVGGEPSIAFDIANDIFSIEPNFFGVGPNVVFANDVVENLPTSGVNVIVLRTFDNDNNAETPFGAGNAANLIAEQVTAPGAGFFIYFNSGLNLPRLVFSSDLNDNTSDLKIVARMINLEGQREVFPDFTEANFVFEPVPEPSSLLLMSSAGVFLAFGYIRRRMHGRRD